MSLSKRQKVLSAVFGVGLVALGADRTILRPQGGPRAASADSLPTTGAVTGTPVKTPAAVEPPAPASLAERLNRLGAGPATDANALRDPFSLPPSWFDTGPAKGEKVPDAIRTFIRKHQLKAVVMQGDESRALVDDSFLVRGQSVDGFKLVVVSDRSAIFERDGKQAVLELAATGVPEERRPQGTVPSR